MITRLTYPCLAVLLYSAFFGTCHGQPQPASSPAATTAQQEDSATAGVFEAAQFDRFAGEGSREDIRWKIHTLCHGLSVHQRMVAHIELEIPGSELVKRARDGKLAALVQVEDEEGHHYRDFGFIELAEAKPELRKQTWQSTWEAFALPGRYKLSLLIYDSRTREHSFAQTSLRVDGLKNDRFPEIWQGLPKWEFWAPLKELRDNIYRSDVDSRLNLRLASTHPTQVEVLADLTPSDLFHGSARFYSRFLAVALPLLKDLSQIEVPNGSLDVATLDLRQRRVTFEQDNVTANLNWGALKTVVAPENGPGMIDIRGLQQKQEQPDFLRDEVLRRLQDSPTFKVFIVVGSPMDFYAFHHFPDINKAQAENCIVYYLQYEVYGPYATGALGNVKKMLKPLPIHTIKVRTAESVREALQRILREAGQM